MKQFTVKQIGTMEMDKDGMYVKLLPEYHASAVLASLPSK